jgi:hypothetical protein
MFDIVFHSSVWPHVTVFDADHALVPGFLEQLRPQRLVIHATQVRAAEELLSSQAVLDPMRVTHLTLFFNGGTFPKDNYLVDCLERFTNLKELKIFCQNTVSTRKHGFVFTGFFPNLERLWVVGQPASTLEVYFWGQVIPKLHSVVMEVATSDILAHLPKFPAMESVRYLSQREDYEDADFRCSQLRDLEVTIKTHRAAANFFRAIASGGHVDTVHVHDQAASMTLTHELSIGRLLISLETRDTRDKEPAELDGINPMDTYGITLSKRALFGVGALQFAVPYSASSHDPVTIRFIQYRSWEDFMQCIGRLKIVFPVYAQVVVGDYTLAG